MGKKAKRSLLSENPAWALALLTFVLANILVFVLNDESEAEIPGYSQGEIIKIIFYDLVIAICCFLICRAHPKSVWYTPVISNALAIIAVIVAIVSPYQLAAGEPWFFSGSSLFMSIIGAILGARVGRQSEIRTK